MRRTAGVQVPEAAFRVVGENDLILAGDAMVRAKKEQALVYLYPSQDHPFEGARLFIDGRDKGSLPGTLPLPSGRHHVGMYAEAGELLAEGALTIRESKVYSADEMARMLRGPSGGISVQTEVLPNLSTQGLLDNPGVGGAIRLALRQNTGPRRGLMRSVSLGGAREIEDGVSMAWLEGTIGLQQDIRWVRYRVGGTLGLVNLFPKLEGGRPGWLFLTAGPHLSAGVVLGEATTLQLSADLQTSALDLNDDGQIEPVWWPRLGLGIELAY